MPSHMHPLVPLAAALALAACDLQPDPPAGPAPLPAGRFVEVQIEYRQPNGCQNSSSSCDNLVVFFGSWMRPGQGQE